MSDRTNLSRNASPAAPAPAAPVAIEALSVLYGERVALARVSLSVSPGMVYALLGRNGAGKSSLIRCLLGLQKPSTGVARLFGDDSWRRRIATLARLGVVPEEPDAPGLLSPCELESFCKTLYPRWSGPLALRRMERFGVPLATPFARLSKGQKALTLLALALAGEPELLVLDDPTLGLDAVARHALFDELIAELADRGTTVLIATHDFAGVERIADRVGILDAGRLRVDESLESLRARFRRISGPATARAEDLQTMQPIATRTRAFGRDTIVGDFREHALQRFGPDLTAHSMTLEEIFLALVGEASTEAAA